MTTPWLDVFFCSDDLMSKLSEAADNLSDITSKHNVKDKAICDLKEDNEKLKLEKGTAHLIKLRLENQ